MIDQQNVSYTGFLPKNRPKGSGVYTLIHQSQVELQYQGVFDGHKALPGIGFFSISDSANKMHYSNQVKTDKPQKITDLFINILIDLKKIKIIFNKSNINDTFIKIA